VRSSEEREKREGKRGEGKKAAFNNPLSPSSSRFSAFRKVGFGSCGLADGVRRGERGEKKRKSDRLFHFL